MIWEAVKYVTGGLSLAAFLAAVIAYIHRTQARSQERLLKAFSDDTGRIEAVKRTLEYFDVDTAGLTKEQRYDLALAQIHARARRYTIAAIVICVLAAMFAGLCSYAISQATFSRATIPGRAEPGADQHPTLAAAQPNTAPQHTAEPPITTSRPVKGPRLRGHRRHQCPAEGPGL
jgi:hypothetical protein